MSISDTSTISAGSSEKRPGPYLARVVSHLDASYMGNLQVEILRPTGNTDSESEVTQVKYMSPFYGITSERFVGQDPNDYDNTQKSYGMWMIPPDIGTTVVVIFIDGDPKRGYWIGCVQDEAMNFMVPGYAATQKLVTDEYAPDGSYARIPVAEYNKKADENQGAVIADLTAGYKPRHPFADVLDRQGLLYDSARGITTSSARREVPSMVFGISTPGPLDKRDGSPRGPVGKKETKVPNAPVSRLGGSSFVMDDGDERWLRRTPVTDGPPDYASVEDGETDGDPTIPHNELIRLRTRTGHQILLHNSEDLIYITNSRGTAWIELSSDGKIDIYAKDSISVRTENDFNFYADRDINMEAGRNFNLKVGGRHQTEVGADKICIVNGNVAIQVDGKQDETVTGAVAESYGTWDVTSDGAVNITSGSDLNMNVSGASVVSSSGDFTIKAANTAIDGGNVNFNSGIAGDAGTATPAEAPNPLGTIDSPTEVEGGIVTSIMARVPTTEPYPHHENLDATMFKPDATDREAETAIPVPDAWRVYSTNSDTFNRQPPPAEFTPPEEGEE